LIAQPFPTLIAPRQQNTPLATQLETFSSFKQIEASAEGLTRELRAIIERIEASASGSESNKTIE
jgi:hypothetical protein